MIISSLYIDGFGVFHKAGLGPFSRTLTLMLGGNESGKSTCLAFIRTILFGFSDGRSSDNLYPPLSGGVHGGRLVALDDAGREHVIERMAGMKGGLVSVTQPNGAICGQEILPQLLGSANRELFHNVFAFSLGELQRFESLKNEMVKSAMYSAGVGMGRFDLASFEAALGKEEGELYKPGGRIPTINVKLNQLEEIHREVRLLESSLEAYDSLHEKLVNWQGRIREVLEQKMREESKLEGVKRLLSAWEDWVSYCKAKEELAALDIIDNFPPDGQSSLHSLVNLLNDRRKQAKVLELNLINLRKKLEGYRVDERLITQKPAIQQLFRGREHYESILQRMPPLRQDIKETSLEIERLLTTLGPEWNEDRLQSSSGSTSWSESVRRYQSSLHEIRSDQERLGYNQKSLTEQAETVRQIEDEVRREVNAFPEIPGPLDENLVQQLSAGRDQFAGIIRDLPLRQQELSETKRDLVQKVKELDADWDISHIETLDCSVRVREEVRIFRDEFQGSKAALQNQRERCLHLQKEAEHTAAVFIEAQKGLANLPEPKEIDQEFLMEKKRAIRVLNQLLARQNLAWSEKKTLLERLADLKQEAVVAKKQLEQESGLIPLWVIPLGLMVFILGALVFTWLGRGNIGLVLALTGCLAAPLIYLVRRHASRDYEGRKEMIQEHLAAITDKIRIVDDDIDDRAAKLMKIDQEVSEACGVLGLCQMPEATEILSLEENLEREFEVLKTWQAARRRMDEVFDQMKQREEFLRDEEARFLEVNRKHELWLSQWQEWLLNQGWPAHLSTEGALEFLRLLDRGGELVIKSRRASEALSALEFEAEKYAKLAHLVSQVCGWPSLSVEDIGPAVDLLVERLTQEEEKTREMVLIRKDIETAERDYESLSLEISDLQMEMDKLLAGAGAVDEKDFYWRAEIFERRKSLRADLDRLEGSITRLTGSSKGMDEVEAELSESTFFDLSVQKKRLDEIVTTMDNGLKNLYEERARVEEQMRQLSSGERMSELKSSEQALLEELRVLARQWSVIALTRRLMRDARAIYEQERQPGVVKEAGNYFKKLTGEKYTSIFAPLEGGDPEVIAKDKGRKKLSQLSRGTAEQLYLSLRFGFIKEFCKHSVALPVVMDDILVNFDSRRALAAAESIMEFSGSQQVLFFTCHEETVNMFRSLDANVPIIRL
ncbi:MAG: AAA family ATPase [Candidatus Tectomicrobia bacterium]|uniref:AAA family ATPase n=1 Tax=Tectimicrobiota bacterium TaxID=2528274 RepID=A0A933GNQ9_UNCTE|nr:AAA family ATPase [Candidatus Tectomicrobia bacterium]